MKKILLLTGLFTSLGLFATGHHEIIRHRIEPMETVFRISLIYNSTVEDIIHANPGMNPKVLAAGAIIRVPKDTKIRDAAFVESFLYGKPEMPAAEMKNEKPASHKKASIETPIQVSEPVRAAEKPSTIADPAHVEIKTETPVIQKKANEEIPAHIAIPAETEIKTARITSPQTDIETPAQESAIKHTSAEIPVRIIGPATVLHAQMEDENPFLTPMEPHAGYPAGDQVPIKEEMVSDPASADKNATEDENPFMSVHPKPTDGKSKSAKSTAIPTTTSDNE